MLRPATLSTVLAEVGGDLTRLHTRALDVYADGYATGFAHGRSRGHAEGYAHRAQDEADEWRGPRDNLTAYIRSVHGLAERRAEHDPRPARTPAQILAEAHASWGLPFEEVGR